MVLIRGWHTSKRAITVFPSLFLEKHSYWWFPPAKAINKEQAHISWATFQPAFPANIVHVNGPFSLRECFWNCLRRAGGCVLQVLFEKDSVVKETWVTVGGDDVRQASSLQSPSLPRALNIKCAQEVALCMQGLPLKTFFSRATLTLTCV